MKGEKSTYLIAEIGSVHDGSIGNALKLIELAATSGADCVKFQTHIAYSETLFDAPMPSFFKGEPRYEYFERTGFSPDQWKQLKTKCEEQEIDFLSSPFSIDSVNLLEDVGVKHYKIPSGEVTNIPMLEYIAETKKPVLLSSGMSSWEELDDAVNTLLKVHSNITVMQCTSEYPCSYKNVGLNIMLEMKERYKLPIGFSDHTLTNYASYAAVVLGASVIEKHLTFSKKMYGSDAKHSLEPDEFKSLTEGIKSIEEIIDSKVDKDKMASSLIEMKEVFQKSIVTLVDIPKNCTITKEMIGFKKPGMGIPSKQIGKVIGRTTKNLIPKDSLIQEIDLV